MKPRGFTLMELLVALTVFAIIAVALLGQSTGYLAGASLVSKQMAASSLAENELNQILASASLPDLGAEVVMVDYLGHRFSVEVARSATEFALLRRIEVVVTTIDGDGLQSAELSRLVGFKGLH